MGGPVRGVPSGVLREIATAMIFIADDDVKWVAWRGLTWHDMAWCFQEVALSFSSIVYALGIVGHDMQRRFGRMEMIEDSHQCIIKGGVQWPGWALDFP